MSRWWRAYDEALHDPKLQRLSPALFKAWFNLMCIASKNGGVLPSTGEIAFELRMSEHSAAAALAGLAAKGLIDTRADGRFEPHNWGGRQFQSDVTDPTNAERQRRYRNARKTVTPTVTVKRPDTEAETDTEKHSEAKEASAATAAVPDIAEPVDEDPKAKLFRIGKTTLVSFGVAEKRTGALIGQWLKSRNDPVGLLAAIQYARDQNVADPVAYVSTLVNGNKSNGQHGKQDLSAMCFAVADALLEREREEGLDRSAQPG